MLLQQLVIFVCRRIFSILFSTVLKPGNPHIGGWMSSNYDTPIPLSVVKEDLDTPAEVTCFS